MEDCFSLLEKWILENATEYEVYNKNEDEAIIYTIKRKPKKTEEISSAKIEGNIMEIYLEYFDDDWTEIAISTIDLSEVDKEIKNLDDLIKYKPITLNNEEYFTITKKDNKITFDFS